MSRFRLDSVALLAAASWASVASANGIPQALRGHSVTASWTDQRQVRDSMGQERQVTQNSGLTLYMSEAGRVFSRFDRSTRHSADTQMQVSGQPDNFLQWNWEGGALVADQHFVRGARRVSLRFGGGGASCSLNVLHGKAIGSPNIVYSDFSNHTRYEILSIAVTATSCSIRPGNAFGGSN